MAVRPVAETIDHDASFNDALEMPFRELERYCARNALAEAEVCQLFCVNGQVLFLGMGARGKGAISPSLAQRL
jgi:hypothetical protein